ncbi:hypothetical protein M758_11G101600 [Ceratodon purpureus]|uniref:Uncharacterized protein n=1 Tax=Ceratodon purpureus TaxID=3225 RepID=A0A8T0GD40_CERPU|nr:hypothetical protein KC19_11G105500 [Ceratodon purpureus]KAG0601319.1 hypothetical protein M758_11G101600 [Ceratodon purpureus]
MADQGRRQNAFLSEMKLHPPGFRRRLVSSCCNSSSASPPLPCCFLPFSAFSLLSAHNAAASSLSHLFSSPPPCEQVSPYTSFWVP